MSCKYEWLRMIKISIIEHALNNSNLKEEYYPVKESLLIKLKEGLY